MNSSKQAAVPSAPAVTTVQNAENTNAATGTQQLNQTNQVTPLGGITYTQSQGPGGLPQYTATQTLSPAEQQLLTQQQALQGQANTTGAADLAAATPLNLSNNSVMNALAATQAPLFNQQEAIQQEALDSQLNNAGFHTGDVASNNAQENFGLTESNAWNNVISSDYAQQVASLEAQSQIPVQEAATLAGLGAAQFPSAISTPQTQIQPTNSAGIAQNTFQDQATNAQIAAANQQALMGGLFGLGGAAITGGATLLKPTAAPTIINNTG